MEIGYIKLYRKITNSFVWTNPNMLKLWLLCLMKASHKGNKFLFNGKEIVVNSGEFVTGRAAITKEMNEGVPNEQQVNSTSVWRWLKKFESEEMLDIKSTTKYSVISIKNWHDYQVGEQQLDNKRTSTGQRVDTIKNDKNEENDKNEKNKDIPQKSKKRIYETDSIYYQLAQSLFTNIQTNNPEAKEPNLQTWADDMRKMVELDNRKPEQVENMIHWCQSHEFWSGIILSSKKLREKYDQMKVQANNSQKPKSYSTPFAGKKPVRKEKLPDWAQKGYQAPKETPIDPDVAKELQERLARIRNFQPNQD